MKYPVIIHKDKDSAYGLTMPDFPSCFSAGDSVDEVLGHVQEIVELYYDGESDLPVPSPSSLESVVEAEVARGGIVLQTEVDLSFLGGKTVAVNITMPEYARRQIDKAAAAKGMNRSAYLTEAGLLHAHQ